MSYSGISQDTIIVDRVNNQVIIKPITQFYEWRKLQVQFDSLKKREIYYKEIIDKKDYAIKELKSANTELDKVPELLTSQLIKEENKNKVVKKQNSNLKKGIGISAIIVILETILLLK